MKCLFQKLIKFLNGPTRFVRGLVTIQILCHWVNWLPKWTFCKIGIKMILVDSGIDLTLTHKTVPTRGPNKVDKRKLVTLIGTGKSN